MTRILFDQNVPVPLRRFLSDDVTTAYELGWSSLGNGELIEAAERHGFEVLLTSDQNLIYQQDLAGRQIAIVVLMTNDWDRMRASVDAIQEAVADAVVGSYIEVRMPRPG